MRSSRRRARGLALKEKLARLAKGRRYSRLHRSDRGLPSRYSLDTFGPRLDGRCSRPGMKFERRSTLDRCNSEDRPDIDFMLFLEASTVDRAGKEDNSDRDFIWFSEMSMYVR